MRRYQNKIPVKGTKYFIEYSWECNEYLILMENKDIEDKKCCWIIETVVQTLSEAVDWIKQARMFK